MRRSVKIIAIAMVLVVSVGAYYHFSSSPQEEQSSAENGKKSKKGGGTVPVGVAPATIGNIDVFLNGLGNVTPRSTVIVHSRVDGQLMRVLFHEGQLVKENDLLAELDARPYQAQLEQAEGQLMRDEALLKEARIDLQRYQTLFAQDSIAKQQLDTQTSLVQQYAGAVKNDQGLIDSAKVQIAYTRITSPVNGRVGLRQVDPGNIVHAADSNGIVVVTELQPITTIFTIPEDNIPSVMNHTQGNKKLAAEAWDRDNKNKLATGVLTAIDNQVDPTTGTVKFRAEFPNKDNALFPSQFVNVRLRLDTKTGVVLIPTAAIQRGTQGTFVYVAKDNKAAMQPVTLGTAEGEIVSVDKGLQAGDMVIIDGSDSLSDGAKIEVASPDKDKKNAKDKKDKGDGSAHHKSKKHSDNTDTSN